MTHRHNHYKVDPGSYRDPAGYVFYKSGILYRQVNRSFEKHFSRLMDSGAYDQFVKKGWLLPHQPAMGNLTGDDDWFATIQPEKIPFISYPYEWSFNMLKDAALLTLQLARESIRFKLILKDASPFNVQWWKGKMIFIDTLSFELYDETKPWIAYRQFCECFLSPLLLMHYSRQQLQPLMLAYPDGIPLAVTRSLLPFRARFSLQVYLHIFLHASISGRAQKKGKPRKTDFSRQKLLNVLNSLESTIRSLKLPTEGIWTDYYDEAATRDSYLTQKKQVVEEWLRKLPDTKKVADLGANEGVFSKLAASLGKKVIAADLDPFCIDRLYSGVSEGQEEHLLPLVLNLTAPSPSAGFNNEERPSFKLRCKPDLVLALALIHHLCIGNNIPPRLCAKFFYELTPLLLLEFVPAEDEKVIQMISQKKISYPGYTKEGLKDAFCEYFTVEKEQHLGRSGRILWLLRRK